MRSVVCQRPRTQDLRRFLERCIDRAQRAVGEEIGEGEDVDADHEDDAAHGEDVDRPGLEAERPAAAARLNCPASGPEQDDVGERGQIGRRDVGERHQRVHGIAQRHVGAGRRPGQRHADQRRSCTPVPQRELQRVDQRGVVLRARERALEMLEAERLRQAEARQGAATAADSRQGTAAARRPAPSTQRSARPKPRARRCRRRGGRRAATPADAAPCMPLPFPDAAAVGVSCPTRRRRWRSSGRGSWLRSCLYSA